MPNLADTFWMLLIIILLMIVVIYLTFIFLKNQFSSRLNQITEREALLRENFSDYKRSTEDQISTLNAKIEKLQQENSLMAQDVTSLSTIKESLENRIEEFKTHITKLDSQLYNTELLKNDLQISLTKANSKNENLIKRLNEERTQLEELNKKFSTEFENLAQRILDEKSEKFAKQNQENLSVILHPLQERIQGFEKRVENTHKESIEHGAKLRQQIIGLKELNEQMSIEANNLTRALKGESKTQGNWGEMILESVLEKSGLQKDQEYFVQQSFQTEDGKRVLPDVVIHLPGNKKIIIDSKVSLIAYEKYVNSNENVDRTQWQKMHYRSIERHIDQLSSKNYHKLYEMDSLDFVMLFIPIESAFALASQTSPSLYRDAFEKNIILVTPTTLLAVLRTIDTLWQNEKQKKNAIDIATQAGLLYDTFANLLNELVKVGNQMDTAKGSYDSAMKKLTGNRNLFKNIQKLKKLGAKASKQIDENILKSVDLDNDEED